MLNTLYQLPFAKRLRARHALGSSNGLLLEGRKERSQAKPGLFGGEPAQTAVDWRDYSFDKEVVLNAIPRGMKTSAIHVSVTPTPADGSFRVLGKMANGATGCVTLKGKVYAARLPFVDRTIRIQYLGGTEAVQIALESFAHL